MKFLFLLLLPVLVAPVFAEQQPTDQGTLIVNLSTEPENPTPLGETKIKIEFLNPQTKAIQEHVDYKVTVTNGESQVFGPIPTTHTSIGAVTIPMQLKSGENKITIDIEGILFKPIPLETVSFNVNAQEQMTTDKKSGCLIATAAYGTELAPQVQLLREIRDNALFTTNSGITFMAGFNEFYYSFSPIVADWERENTLFRETVKMTITPMLSTMSILNYASIDSESEMLGYGIGVILVNIGMYFVAPAILISKIHKTIRRSSQRTSNL
mgnify:FL=1